MMRPNDPEHVALRSFLRVLGPALALVGLIFMIVGIGSFFSSFGSFKGPPDKFWCVFVGMPLLAVGIGITKFAYLGAAARYVSNEVTPVVTDAASYVARGTKGAVREVAAAVADGIRAGAAGGAGVTGALRCPRCGAGNDPDASFCKGCGGAMARTRACASCGEPADGDARFCDRCGSPLAGA